MIDKFDGQYRFLSNFYSDSPGSLTLEHYYQAAKTTNFIWQYRILKASTPGHAKRLGRQAPLRSDWEEIKLSIMEFLVREKFSNNYLKQKLLETDTQELIEGNNWNDTFWGVCNGIGENHLGRILMKIREELRNGMA